MKKNWIKLLLDVVMAVLLFTLFSTSFTGLTFHEIAGLVVFGLVILHLILNWKWIWAFTKKLFSKGIPFKTRFGYVLNVVLLINFVMIILTGIMISRTLFVNVLPAMANARVLHTFFSALSVIIVGIHLGLHWDFIKAMFGRVFKLPAKVGKAVGAVALILIVVFGSYGLVTSRFTQWLAGSVTGISENGFHEGQGGRGPGNHDGQLLPEDQNGTLPDGSERFDDRQGRDGGSLSGLAIVAEVGAIMVMVAAATAGTESLIKRRKKKEPTTV